MRFAKVSIALLVLQLLIVSTVAGKYVYQRVTCPRVWTRTAAYDPSLVMRGRYLSLQLIVNGCGSTLPSARDAQFPRDMNGVPGGSTFSIRSADTVWFQAKIAVKDNKLIAVRVPESETSSFTQTVAVWPAAPCDQMRLSQPVDFYIPEHANDPTWLKQGQQLWIEVTVPPKGPPRPLQLALKDNNAWRPLAFQ
ncbi:MAG TPA: hypothetical protein VKB47_11220 [Terracidiphilus sp.]|nr:hypothetical protein [Terracidiphilus sp.]